MHIKERVSRKSIGNLAPGGVETTTMGSLIVLAVMLGLTFAQPGHTPMRGPWGVNYAAARIEAQGVRIARLSKLIDSLAQRIEDDDASDYHRVVNELERRLERLEGNDCHEHEFSCGRKSGECISELLVCDSKSDCHNGHDEDEAICRNQVPAGRSWSGVVNWSGCMTRPSNHMNLLITGNRRLNHFPTRLYVDAVIVARWNDGHEDHTETWNTQGYWNYGRTQLVLAPPEGSTKRIGMLCDDAGEGVADCKMLRESDLSQCGHAILTRTV